MYDSITITSIMKINRHGDITPIHILTTSKSFDHEL